MADEGFHEIQLSGKHLVALFMAATVVAVVIFLCGVMVGRGVGAQRIAAEARELPADPTAEVRQTEAPEPSAPTTGAASSSDEKLTYPERLDGDAPSPETLKPQVRVAPPPAPAPRPVRAAPSPSDEPAGSGFAVQVAAVRERDEADIIARRLSTKGYQAYVMAPAAGAPRVFRVRVGKFRERREAEQIAARLQKEEQFKPWITR